MKARTKTKLYLALAIAGLVLGVVSKLASKASGMIRKPVRRSV